ncbi:MAG: TolC family protein [Chthoniobacteraceae bacterium]
MIRPTAAALLAATFFAGCSVDPSGSFRGVERIVGAKTGGKRLHWMRGNAAADAEAQRAVKTLLRRQLTADSAAQVALLNNRSVQSSFEELGIAHADYLEALLPSNPSFSGSLRYSDRPPFGSNIEGQAAASVLDLLLLPVKRKVAAAQLRAAKYSVASEVLSLVTETKTAFYTLQAREQLVGRMDLIAKTNQAALDIAQRQHQAGNLTDLELVNQQALYSQSRVDVAQTRAKIRSDRERLNRLMGVWGADLNWRVANQLPPVPKKEISLAGLEKRALAERLDVALARQNVAAIQYALKARGATRYLPASIDVGVSREKEVDRTVLTGPTLDLQIPLFNFGQAAIPRLQAQYRQAQHELEAIAVNARSEVREARDLVVANRELSQFYEKTLLPQRLQIVNQTALHYNAMQIGPIELLSAKERQLTTERAYVDAWRDYWIARVQLERALIGSGGGGRALPRRGGGAASPGEQRAAPQSEGAEQGEDSRVAPESGS